MTEDVNHFLLECPLYLTARLKMLQSLMGLVNINDLDVSVLLHGSDEYDFNTNKGIFKIVHSRLFMTLYLRVIVFHYIYCSQFTLRLYSSYTPGRTCINVT